MRIRNRLLRIRIHCFGRTPIRIRIQGFCDQHKKLQYTYPSTSKHEITLVIFLCVIFALLDVDPIRTRNTAYVYLCRAAGDPAVPVRPQLAAARGPAPTRPEVPGRQHQQQNSHARTNQKHQKVCLVADPDPSQNSRNQGFSYYLCLMIEGSGSGSIPLANGSGSKRPKNTWLRIRICNTGAEL